ncbi:MAG: NifB/NifX family molybdenum-iron cluster-binding protein [Nitrospiraceae bacterium]|nr:NifB/NifX family molybdenum-iron cluster-binding protein [Nitrospiraceae bacterium]MDA8090912.1 NifB/NifX family molybdenum-iron cluster-binding protein [Nitrospiraceae bacterium]
MNICFPVGKDEGLDSRVFEHFGSAPAFLVVDVESKEKKTLINGDQHHAHGMCSPFKALSGEQVDAVIVGGIGRGALMKLSGAGIKVYKALEGTVAGNMKLFEEGRLPVFSTVMVCPGHEGCAH